MSNISWQFDTIHGREDDVSNALIESFEGDYNYYLAREVLQNAIDAKNPDSIDPVKVVFTLEEFTKSMFPNYDEYVRIYSAAKEFWPEEKVKTHAFLDKAIECLNQNKIPVLKISDYNTVGLNGDDNDRNSPWYGLVKSVGSTTKHEGQGGSFGLGKGAPFAASYLRTLFYSTKNKRSQNVFQGVAELVSHKDSEGNKKRGSGSYGNMGQSSIRNRREIEEHMVRKERGLDIFIMGYKEEQNWQERLMESVLRNFWLAIHDNLLIVDIDGEVLTSRNLEEKLTKFYINEPNKDNAKPEGNPLQFYQAYKKGIKKTKILDTLGEVSFHFYRTEESLNRVAMIRKSKMVIYSKDFRWHAPYAGVFVCDNDIGNQELRKMETPQHNTWDKNRNKVNGEKIESELRNFIRGVLKSFAKIKEGGIIEIPGVHKWLPFDKDGEIKGDGKSGIKYTGKKGSDESSREIAEVEEFEESVTVTPYKVSVINELNSGFGNGGKLVRKGKKKLKKGKKAQGGGKGNPNALLNSNLNSRVFVINKNDNNLIYRVKIRSEIEGKCKLKLIAMGEEGREKVNIKEVNDDLGNRYSSAGNRINGINIDTGQELNLNVEINSPSKLSIKLEAYDLQQ